MLKKKADSLFFCAGLIGGLSPLPCHGKDDIGSVEMTTLPACFHGTWVVKAVHVDNEAGRRLAYQRGDPDLMGKNFTIDVKRIMSTTPEPGPCLNYKVAKWVVDAGTLMRLSVAWHGYPASPATVKDYSLPLEQDSPVEAYFVKCEIGYFGHYAAPELPSPLGVDYGSWMLKLGSGELAV